jgi:hypothetical protein
VISTYSEQLDTLAEKLNDLGDSGPQGHAAEVAKLFLKLGLTAFGDLQRISPCSMMRLSNVVNG